MAKAQQGGSLPPGMRTVAEDLAAEVGISLKRSPKRSRAVALSCEYKRRITKHLRGAAAFGIEQHRRHQEFKDLVELDAQVTGLLSFAHMVEPGWAEERLENWKRLREIPLEHEEPVTVQRGLDLPWAAEVAASQAELAKASIDDLVRDAQRCRSSSDYRQLARLPGWSSLSCRASAWPVRPAWECAWGLLREPQPTSGRSSTETP